MTGRARFASGSGAIPEDRRRIVLVLRKFLEFAYASRTHFSPAQLFSPNYRP